MVSSVPSKCFLSLIVMIDLNLRGLSRRHTADFGELDVDHKTEMAAGTITWKYGEQGKRSAVGGEPDFGHLGIVPDEDTLGIVPNEKDPQFAETKFTCPLGCSQCCQSRRRRKTEFKCVSQFGAAPPLGRSCSAATTRNSGYSGTILQYRIPGKLGGIWKLHCKFTKNEITRNEWKHLKKKCTPKSLSSNKLRYFGGADNYTATHIKGDAHDPSDHWWNLAPPTKKIGNGTRRDLSTRKVSRGYGPVGGILGTAVAGLGIISSLALAGASDPIVALSGSAVSAWIGKKVQRFIAKRKFGVKNDFICPEECAECCVGHVNRFLISRKFTRSRTVFKCLLRKTDQLPRGRFCSDPQKRNSMKNKQKVECRFTDDEVSLRVWQRLRLKCSTEFRCCCTATENWSEEVCMPLDTPPQIWMKSWRGTDELYAKGDQQYQNRFEPCKQAKNGQRFDEPYPRTGCCVKTHQEQRCESCNCDDDGCDQCCYWVTVCDAFELLYACSHGGFGVVQDGLLFRRLSSLPGTCVGNRASFIDALHMNLPTSSYAPRSLIEEAWTTPRNSGTMTYTSCPQSSWIQGADFSTCKCNTNSVLC